MCNSKTSLQSFANANTLVTEFRGHRSQIRHKKTQTSYSYVTTKYCNQNNTVKTFLNQICAHPQHELLIDHKHRQKDSATSC